VPRAVESLDIADVVILATPAPVSAKLLGIPNPVPYVTSTVVALGFEGVTLPPGAGFLSPGRRIAGATFSSNKFEGRAPDGGALVRVFFHGEGSVEIAREELRPFVTAEPVVTRVFRHSSPVYEIGHRVPPTPPNVFLTGAAWRGVGIPDLIADARRTADVVRTRV
jgi:oxygen-dependent protoporphyrinogen oxidase